MKYVAFIEVNHKEHECYYTYLQYDGNEDVLNVFDQILKEADFSSMFGDYSEFFIDINNLLSEETINEQCKIKFDGYYPFSVCKGKFDFCDEEFFNKDSKEKALLLDEMFYANQIQNYFE
jgi:hypothetical protein